MGGEGQRESGGGEKEGGGANEPVIFGPPASKWKDRQADRQTGR